MLVFESDIAFFMCLYETKGAVNLELRDILFHINKIYTYTLRAKIPPSLRKLVKNKSHYREISVLSEKIQEFLQTKRL